jgi:hypothetical protein
VKRVVGRDGEPASHFFWSGRGLWGTVLSFEISNFGFQILNHEPGITFFVSGS